MRPIARSYWIATALAWALPTGSAQAQAAAPTEQISLRSVANFGFDQTTLQPRDQASMLAEVGKMKDVSWQTVRAVGYTDSVGAADYNERLSVRRAEAVKAYLVSKGLMPEMIRAEGRAEAAPVASNATAAGRAKNRRTEVEFVGVRTAQR